LYWGEHRVERNPEINNIMWVSGLQPAGQQPPDNCYIGQLPPGELPPVQLLSRTSAGKDNLHTRQLLTRQMPPKASDV